MTGSSIGPSRDPAEAVDKWSLAGPIIDLVLVSVGLFLFFIGDAPRWANGMLLILIAAIPWRSS